jgi:hypothetical protein
LWWWHHLPVTMVKLQASFSAPPFISRPMMMASKMMTSLFFHAHCAGSESKIMKSTVWLSAAYANILL